MYMYWSKHQTSVHHSRLACLLTNWVKCRENLCNLFKRNRPKCLRTSIANISYFMLFFLELSNEHPLVWFSRDTVSLAHIFFLASLFKWLACLSQFSPCGGPPDVIRLRKLLRHNNLMYLQFQ